MNIKEYQRWVENYHAEYEFLKFTNENYYPKALNEMCFHGQQVIEKALKSYLILRDHADAIRHHDLIRLAYDINEVDGKVIFPPEELKKLGAITRFAVNTRYPQEYPCTESDLHLTISCCENIIHEIEQMALDFIKKERSVDNKINNAKNQNSKNSDTDTNKPQKQHDKLER